MLSCFFSLSAYLVENCLNYEAISAAPALMPQNSVWVLSFLWALRVRYGKYCLNYVAQSWQEIINVCMFVCMPSYKGSYCCRTFKKSECVNKFEWKFHAHASGGGGGSLSYMFKVIVAFRMRKLQKEIADTCWNKNIHIHTHTHIYIYICVCVCVCVRGGGVFVCV